MITMQYKKSIRTGSLLAVILIITGCDIIPDNTSSKDPLFITEMYEKTFKIDSLLIFNREPGYSVDFSGTRSCTLSVNGSIVSVHNKDSLYQRITCSGDTIISPNDSFIGKALFLMEDVIGWGTMHRYILDTNNILGRTIMSQLSEQEDSIIKTCDTSKTFGKSNKEILLRAINKAVDVPDFYQKNRIAVLNEIYFIFMLKQFKKDVDGLMAQSIMLDTNGTVKSDLSLYEREAMRWFNRDIIVKYIDNEYIAEDRGKIFKKFPSCGRIFAMHFQQGPSRNSPPETEILRLFEIKSSALSQIAFNDQSGYHTASKTKIHDYPYMCDTSWTVTPLPLYPDVPFISRKDFLPLLQPGKAILKYNGLSWDIDSVWSYTLSLYYIVAGSMLQNEKPVRIAGTITVTAKYFKSNNSDLDKYQGYFSGWNTETNVQMIDDDGNTSHYKETCILKSDDGTGNR